MSICIIGIHSIGTVRRNRIPNCKLPLDEEMNKKPRGTSIQFVANCDDIEVASVLWKDNKSVSLISTFVEVEPQTEIKRFDRKNKQVINVKCPAIIKEYNRHMGGVDLLDSMIGRYRIKMKSRKWYHRLTYHLIDLCVINAWFLHHRKGGKLKLLNFRKELAATLLQINSKQFTRTRASESPSVEVLHQQKRKKGPTQAIPPSDVRQDCMDHFPEYMNNRLRCKLPRCSAQTFIKCCKCGVALCFNKQNNCFLKFHKK